MRSKVVFPQPDGPNKVKNSPSRISRLRSGIITFSPYFFTAWRIEIDTLNVLPSLSNNFFFLAEMHYTDVSAK